MLWCLVLNADWSPLRVVGWTVGVELMYDGKATLVEQSPGRWVRSPSTTYPWPSVVVLRRYSSARGRAKFSSRNLMARDSWRCCYCGAAPRLGDGRADRKALTVDHVIPKAQAKNAQVYAPQLRRWVLQTCWMNCVTACKSCNRVKADQRPEQAGMRLLWLPREPSRDDVARMSVARIGRVPAEWAAYLPQHWLEPLGLGEHGVVGDDDLQVPVGGG